MKILPLPPAINLYRARLIEVRAIDCGDGRFVVLEDPPRYVDSAVFEAGFQLVEERRPGPRRQTQGKPKAKRGKRTGAGRRKKNSTAQSKGRQPSSERIMGLELWNAGNQVSTIARTLGKVPSVVHYWKKKDKWSEHRKAAPAEPPARAAVTTVKGSVKTDDPWMN